MRHVIRVITLILFAAVIAGCQNAHVKPDYERYTELVRQQEQERQARVAAIAKTDDCNGDATCVVAAKALAALAEATAPKQSVAPPQQKRSFGDRVENVLITGIKQAVPLGGIYAGIESGKRQERTQIRQYEMLENVTVAGLNTAAEIAQSGPSINVGGNYGDTDNSTHGPIDSYNQDNDQDNDVDQSGDGSAFGDDNDLNNGDNNDNSGEIRDNSDGPISDDGNDCSGESCNPTAPVEESP